MKNESGQFKERSLDVLFPIQISYSWTQSRDRSQLHMILVEFFRPNNKAHTSFAKKLGYFRLNSIRPKTVAR